MEQRSTRVKPVSIFSFILFLFGAGYADDNAPALEFRLIGDTDVTIAPGESIPIILSATLEGPGELTLQTRDEPRFATGLRKKVECESDCEIVERIVLAPTADDCGKYKFRIEATFKSGGEELRKTHTVLVAVVPKILAEPPFTGDLFNEILWVPCTTHNHELFFSPLTTIDMRKLAPSALDLTTTDLDRQIVENLSNGVRYDYWVKATLPDGVSTLTSDRVHSIQDNTPSPSVAPFDFSVSQHAEVTLRWPVLGDEISFIERYQIFRRQARPEESDFVEVASLPFFPVSDISPQNYYPVAAEKGGAIYTDAEGTILSVPEELDWSMLIRTSVDDRWNMEEEFLRFELLAESHVYVAIDRDIKPQPNWLKDRFTKRFVSPDLILKTTAGNFRVFKSREPLPTGTVTLGGNFAEGSGINHSEPSMYLVFVKPVGKVLPYASKGEVTFVDALGESDDLKTFQYRIDAIDAAGNVADGVPSPPIILDLHGKCKPKITDWFVFENQAGEQFGEGLSNQICIDDPDLDLECARFRESDSLRFQAVRDSVKFFDSHLPEDEGLRFFDSGWLPTDSLCYTFRFGSEDGDLNFVNGHNYIYRVRAKDFHGNLSAWSDTVSAIQDVFPPGDIRNLACEPRIFEECTDGIMKVSWDPAFDDPSGVASYQVYRKIEEEDFQLIGVVDDSVTMFADTLGHIRRPAVVHYKVGSTDNLGHVRDIEDSDLEIWKRAPIGPILRPDSLDVVSCPGFLGTSLDTVRIILAGDSTDVLKYIVTVQGPESAKEFFIRDTSIDTVAIPLNEGDGTYWITARAEYPNITSTCSDSLHITKRKQSPPPVENLMAMQDPLPTGNIILKWTHPDTSLLAEYRVFVWSEGEVMPSTPYAVIKPPLSVNRLEIPDLVTYECDSFKVQVVDCFGNISEDDPVDTQYSNRPPRIRCDEAEVRPDSIVIRWDRPEPRHLKALDFMTLVEVFQDSIAGEPLKVDTVRNNKQTYICFSPEPMHTYFFRVKEIITSNLMQSCPDTFMTTFSRPCSVPFENLPNPVDSLEVQAQPVLNTSSSGCAFFSWQKYVEKPTVNVEHFQVRYWALGSTDTVAVQVLSRDTLICDLDPELMFQGTVTAIDDFGQRSVGNNIVDFDFKPRWVFTPDAVRMEDCFRDSVMVSWDWVDQDTLPVLDMTFGADMVQAQISIDRAFQNDTTTTPWMPITRKHTFSREDYPFVSRQNDTLYARVRAKDKFGHVSPWSNEFFGLAFGRFDDLPPSIVTCEISALRPPEVIDDNFNTVNVHLAWRQAVDNCRGTVIYKIFRNDSLVAIKPDTTHVDENIPADSLRNFVWKVLPADTLGNEQTSARLCRVTVFLCPPKESELIGQGQGNGKITWQACDQTNV
ncbi:hypothetical protein MJD09_01375, partial [bacterium]|nr:hypothetical protein [bacterium]